MPTNDRMSAVSLAPVAPIVRTEVLSKVERAEPGVASILALMRAHDAADPDDLHASIAAPTLIITGAQDRSRPQQEALRERIRGAEQIVIPDAGHCCNLEQPIAYDRAALGFLARHGLGAIEASGAP